MRAPGSSVAPVSSHRRTWAATWRPSSAATSAVSTGCTTLPAAKTPDRDVRRAESTRGPFVAGSRSIPPSRTSSWSGIQPPVNTTTSHATTRVCPVRRLRISTPSTTSFPTTRTTCVRADTGTRSASRAPSRNADHVSPRSCSVVISTVSVPASRRVSTADQLTSSAPTTTARRPGVRCCRCTRFCSCPVVSTPDGRSPGTRRAVRGRSRAPVARSTAPPVTVMRPCGLVTSRLRSPDQPVTVASVRTSAPASRARPTSRRAYAGPLVTRRRSRAP